MQPSVSVVLPVYNCPQYVGEAIDSILAQTFGGFELILIDDGSTDETPRVLERYGDARIRLYTQQNRGLAATLNRGIELARGRYIARQDQDDVSRPERLGRQATFLDEHPECALVGAWAQIMGGGEITQRMHRHPPGNAALKFELLLNNPFVHSSVTMRKAALDRVGVYCTDRSRQPPEDFELWSRIAREYEVANIPEVLHYYREIEGSMSRQGESPFLRHLVTICAENIAWAAGGDPADPQIVNIAALTHQAPSRVKEPLNFGAMRDTLKRAAIRVTKDESGHYSREAEARVNALRYRLFEMRHGHGWRRHLFRAARGVVRLVKGA
jgi:hypothetical protein